MTLRVTVEIVPYGVEANKRTIHTIELHNTGTKTPAGATRYNMDLDGKRMEFKVLHTREDGALTLILRALHRARI